jgi:hypothetical protein
VGCGRAVLDPEEAEEVVVLDGLNDLEIPNRRVVNQDEVPVFGAEAETDDDATPVVPGRAGTRGGDLLFSFFPLGEGARGAGLEVVGVGIPIFGLAGAVTDPTPPTLGRVSLFILGKTLKLLNAFLVFSIDFTVNNCRCFVGLVFLLPLAFVFVFDSPDELAVEVL